MNRHVMQVPQTSLQGSCKLGDGALLLHGSDRGHHPELDHQKPKANRLGYLGALRPHGPDLGHLQIRRPLKLRSQAVIVSIDHLYRVDAGAAHPANARSVTQTFPTTGKPVDTGKARNVSKTERIAGKAGNPALAANTPFRGDFPQSVEKGGDFLNLRKCGGRP